MDEKLIRVSNYAREKKMSVVQVYRLIKSKKIKSKVIDGFFFVIKED